MRIKVELVSGRSASGTVSTASIPTVESLLRHGRLSVDSLPWITLDLDEGWCKVQLAHVEIIRVLSE